MTVVNASDKQPSVQAQDIIGWVMWIIGILVEITADQQKLAFKNSPENRGKWCSDDLWKYSRHPNYFGEVSPFKCLFFCVVVCGSCCEFRCRKIQPDGATDELLVPQEQISHACTNNIMTSRRF